MKEVADLLLAGKIAEAKTFSNRNYPFEIKKIPKRSINRRKTLEIFIRDGFTDRYSREKGGVVTLVL